MPRYRNPDGDYRSSVLISKAQFWCLEYLETIQSESASDILNEALEFAIKNINRPEVYLEKPGPPEKPIKRWFRINRETRVAFEIARINRELYDWCIADFMRWGLYHVLAKYAVRFPEMEKIIERFEMGREIPLNVKERKEDIWS